MSDCTTEVLVDVYKERRRQNEKWGVQNLTAPEWITVLTEEVGEAAQEACRIHFGKDPVAIILAKRDMRTELLHVAAVAAAAVECLDRAEVAA
jgi:hypothetical protein